VDDRARAEAAFAALIGDLGGYEIAGTKREYTVYDGRVELDAGWL
jgi:hypothetical protein